MRSFLLGLVLGLLILPVSVWTWLHFGHPPVSVADPALPMERQLVNIPLHARIEREMPSRSAMSASPANLLIGAELYRQECASCHGQYGHPSGFGPHMFPRAPQLWAPHGKGVIGVSDDPAGETYWKIKNGIRLSGMPAYGKTLSETQMWQVATLLANADKPIPSDVMRVLQQPLVPGTPAVPESGPGSPIVIPVQPLPNE